jgi:hypothetical protein
VAAGTTRSSTAWSRGRESGRRRSEGPGSGLFFFIRLKGFFRMGHFLSMSEEEANPPGEPGEDPEPPLSGFILKLVANPRS